MCDHIDLIQRAAPGSSSTMVGVQYIGLTPEEASRQMINIFMDNFPRLQQIAASTAKRRVDEFCEEVLKRIEEKRIRDLSPFTDPDVQYVLWEAQKDYARFGKQDMLHTLSSLIASRIQHDKDDYLKTIIDRALQIAGYMTSEQLDYLTVLFICKQVKLGAVRTINDLEHELCYLETQFNPSLPASTSLLNSLGCFDFVLGSVCEIMGKTYGFSEEDVVRVCPEKFMGLAQDYGTSHIGSMLAITNARNKSKYCFDYEIWIHP